MAKNSKYTVRLKRKRQKKTDYKLRLGLLKSGVNRLVIRKSLKNITVQVVTSENSNDSVLISCHSRELKKYGWDYNLGNIPSSYLTGFLLGKKALKNNMTSLILDIGLQKSVYKSRLYSALKGCIDAGLKVPHNANIFPEEERLKGSHINKEMIKKFEDVKKKIENG